jgi:DNA-binding MarR family transcriptional regulator
MVAIAFDAMKRYPVDSYVVDVLMPDLVGHDRKPAAFLVYLCLLCESEHTRAPTVAMSLQEIAVRSGLAKSSVQSAIRHLKRRQLIDPTIVASTAQPVRRIRKPWAP